MVDISETGSPVSSIVALEEVVVVKGSTTSAPIILLDPGPSPTLPTLTSVPFALTAAQPTLLASETEDEAVAEDAVPC